MKVDLGELLCKQPIGGDKKTFELSDPEDGLIWLRGPGGEELGAYELLGPVPLDGNLSIPDDRERSIVFPVLVDGVARICRFRGPLERATAMFVMHKQWPIAPMTADLRKMASTFDKHDSFRTEWAFSELSLVDIVGKGGVREIERIAIEQGYAKRTKRGVVRTAKR